MKTQSIASEQIRMMPLVAVTLANYAAQVPYYLHNYYSAHPVPSVRVLALLGGTLAWFALGVAGFMRHRGWGSAVLASFLAVEGCFYAKTFATGAFIFQLENQNLLIRTVFITGYVSGAVAVYYAYRLFRIRSRLRARPDRSRP